MFEVVRRATFAAAAAVGALVISVGLVATPASAHSLHDAVRSGYGCGWSSGSYDRLDSEWITTSSGQKIAKVHLLWHGGLEENCAVTQKRYSMHGVPSWTSAWLGRQGYADDSDEGNYSHYAAVSLWAEDTCVQYWGIVELADSPKRHGAGRSNWGNCD